MSLRNMLRPAALIVAAVIGFSLWTGAPVRAQAPTIAVTCPVPGPAVENGVAVCVDRGPGSIYFAGDPITICVTANIPQIAIYPPPPPPTIQVTGSTNGGPETVLIQDAFTSGERCLTATIIPPFGAEVVTARAIGQNGAAFAQDSVTFTSLPR